MRRGECNEERGTFNDPAPYDNPLRGWTAPQKLDIKLLGCSSPPKTGGQYISRISVIFKKNRHGVEQQRICFANRQYRQHIVVRSADIVCTARDAIRRCCQYCGTSKERERLAKPVCRALWFFAFSPYGRRPMVHAMKEQRRKTTKQIYDKSLKVKNCSQIQERTRRFFNTCNWYLKKQSGEI